jgi:hypothetical protein
MTLRLRYRVWKLRALCWVLRRLRAGLVLLLHLAVASLLFAGTGAAAAPQPSIVDGLAVTYAIVNIATAYCPNLAADSEHMRRIDEWKKAINPDEDHFLADIGRHAVNLRRKMDELGEAEWCADALIAFGPPPGEGILRRINPGMESD